MNGMADGGISAKGRPAGLVPVMFPLAEMTAAPEAETPKRSRSPELMNLKLPLLAEPKRSEEHTSELQSPCNLVCRLLLEKKNRRAPTSDPAGYSLPCSPPTLCNSSSP